MTSKKRKNRQNTADRSIIPVSWQVTWPSRINKQLDRAPWYIRHKFHAWAMVIERVGLHEARKIPGYHDEPLQGERQGQRSVRLNRSYRVIYTEDGAGTLLIVEVLEISNHEY